MPAIRPLEDFDYDTTAYEIVADSPGCYAIATTVEEGFTTYELLLESGCDVYDFGAALAAIPADAERVSVVAGDVTALLVYRVAA